MLDRRSKVTSVTELFADCFMGSDIMSEVLPMIDGEVPSWPTAMDFELAYQARVAMDRIRFAIKHAISLAKVRSKCRKPGSNFWMRCRDLKLPIADSRKFRESVPVLDVQTGRVALMLFPQLARPPRVDPRMGVILVPPTQRGRKQALRRVNAG